MISIWTMLQARRLVRLCEDPVLCAGAEDYQQERQLSMDLDHSTPSTSTRQNSTNVADDVDLFLEPWVCVCACFMLVHENM